MNENNNKYNRIIKGLRAVLSKGYVVSEGLPSELGRSIYASPDITILDKKRNRMIMVEIENVGHYDVPYAKVTSVFDLLNKTGMYNHEVVYVSSGSVSDAFKSAVAGSPVKILDNQSLDNVVPKLVETITRRDKSPTLRAKAIPGARMEQRATGLGKKIVNKNVRRKNIKY